MTKLPSFIALVFLGSLINNAAAQFNYEQSGGQQGGGSIGYNQSGGYQQGGYQQGGHHPGGQYGGGYGQPSQSQIISERVLQTVRSYERLRLSDLLRLQGQQGLRIRSLSILASSLLGQAELDVLSLGRSVAIPQIIRRQASEVRVQLPLGTELEDLEISVSKDALIDTITAEVESTYQDPGPLPGQEMQPLSGQMLKLDVRREIQYGQEINLKNLVRKKLGLTLEGAQIERIVLQGVVTRGYSASVQVEMNNRLVGPVKIISASQMNTPIPLNTIDEVRGNLRLIVRGDVQISQINIKVGQVRQIHLPSRPERIQVSREVLPQRALELGSLLPYETRLISSIAIEARTARHQLSQLSLIGLGQILGTISVSQVPMRPVIQLIRPLSARELRLQVSAPVIIDAIEVDFENIRVW